MEQQPAKPRTKKQPGPAAFNLDAPEWYLNRELTWLAFNRRVLHEGEDSARRCWSG